ncbi:hypothetical protein [Microbacterium hominis]|uniref:SDR family NAD(P)-dependent oxidoreductase n=1 Tax=Microbacterium hominis TaxID=162426 RepID=A0A7D4TG06_9MICO|nr:hypothetical protein [Microbacterium hominis]QKJ18961.1 hypothetical protein HQM25_05910 [Microbacterium hominis]
MTGIEREVVLVTDVSSDLGRQLADATVRAGAPRVYACAPEITVFDADRVIPLAVDANDPASVTAMCVRASDVSMVLSTFSSSTWPPVAVGGGDVAALARHFSSTVLRTVRVLSALAPGLSVRGGGVIVCVVSVQAWLNLTGAFAVAQSALWSAINALRLELRGAGIQVIAAVGAFDEADDPSVEAAAEGILAAVRDRRSGEFVLDAYSESVRARLSGPLEMLYPEIDEQ